MGERPVQARSDAGTEERKEKGMTQDERYVVVGTDGSPRALAAVRFAAAEAVRVGGSLRVVHVLPHHVPRTPLLALSTDDLDAVGRHLLSEAVQEARSSVPGVEVASELLHGGVASELVEAARGAELLALGRESTPVRWRVYTGAVTVMVAARARCPVVSVPDTWHPGRDPRGSIVAGFRSDADGPALLEHAFRTAEDLNARLTVLHAWELPRRYHDLLTRQAHDQEWNLTALERIESQVAQLREGHPGVDVEVRVAHEQPALALAQAAEKADLLVLARHESGPAMFHLGETARALLREAACPVMVVPTPRRDGSDHGEGRTAVAAGS